MILKQVSILGLPMILCENANTVPEGVSVVMRGPEKIVA